MSTRPISSADAADAAEVVRLVRERPNDLVDPFPPATEMEVLVDMGSRGKGQPSHPRVAVDGDEVVGWAAIDYSSVMRRAVLVGPVVHPAHRTKGYGSDLLVDLVQCGRDARQRHLRAVIGSNNTAGSALLKAAGFQPRDRHTCVRLARPPAVPELDLEGLRVERVDSEHGDTYYDFTQKLVPRQRRQVRGLLKADDYAAFLAYKDGKPVACIEIDMRYGDVASVETVEAPPSIMSKVGNALLLHAVRLAFEHDRIQSVDLLMAGTDRAQLEKMAEHGFEIRHELVAFEMKL